MFRRIVLVTIATFMLAAPIVNAQTAYEELQAILRAEVVTISDERTERIMGTEAMTTVQTVQARLLEGERSGDVVTFENDLIMLKNGDRIYLSHLRDINGREIFILKDVDRGSGLLFLFGLFVALLLWFAGKQGLRALGSLLLSIIGIVFILLPALLAGYDPILMSLLISAVILALALFGTHGFNALSSIAFGGTVLAVLATSALAWLFVSGLRLSGYGSDASVYLNFATDGQLDLSGLLLGSIIIGVLGVLDDISITQASVVRELRAANNSLGSFELYQRALRVGRDHVGSLVNTLALAYVGAALPLVLLFSTSNAPLYFTLNQEVIAAELTRILIGSIGLILAVPITTAIAAWWFGSRVVLETDNEGHHHHHH
ncbi:hypothetical protein A2392_00680 [Candidatus Kaiserbacteria bacterium RIFOXYB1_FULL_46_14]|uniref:YibE/F family protein n=1 Tax=Candidatus Kaiserbacteria bacterium RIFOXYB1_FULL_46_14 TaxID=1798531 RepID=A0A1F6FJ77_9BACT|nr:MAG: hypothetical protein A2392_00680 [Candidatus Kaiserbacteria bacterium RIFOXYB1_FULL_46_14]